MMTLQNRQQTAERLGVTVRTIDNYVKSGIIPHFKIGGAVRFDPEQVDASLQKYNMRHGKGGAR